MATSPPPRLELLVHLFDARHELDRQLDRLRVLGRRRARARRHVARPETRTSLGQAYLRRVEDEFREALVDIRTARREAQALCRSD